MRAWSLVSARNPIWRATGYGLLLFALFGTGIFIYFGPRPLKPKAQGGTFDGGLEGKIGTYIEQLGQSRFLLAYDSILGEEATLQLKGVHGRLEEPETLWLINSPAARKAKEIWSLDGPMDIEAREPSQQTVLGKGRIEKPEVGLQWDHNIWTGMSTLIWEDLQGQGRGRWTLPPGWRRELDGRFVVENKPVHWEATGPGAMRFLDAQSLWVTLGFKNGRMEQVKAELEGGHIQAKAAEIDPEFMRWLGPITFQRDDGWNGEAASGIAPRAAAEGASPDKIDLKTFKAQRTIPEGVETIQSEGARWTPAGIRAEGDVRWDQPRDGERLSLRAPRVLIREAAGKDLPADLPMGEARAEGTAVISWGNRTLSSPSMDVRRLQRTWRIQAPALGRSEQGTFSAGAGQGNPAHWEFEGPIRANVTLGGYLRGDRLIWNEATWILTGRPATWNGLRERLSGPKLIQKADNLQFPEGVGGSFAAPEGDLAIRADRGEKLAGEVTFLGRVDCQGQGWHLQADRVTVLLGSGNDVKTIIAKGAVSLSGKMGEGKGGYLELDLMNRVARWQGRVKGSAEVLP
jgi:hypothetical protein